MISDRIQWAAKFSDVFTKEENYKLVFNESVLINSKEIIFAINLWRAAKRGLLVYQQDNEQYSQDLFKRPIIRAHLQQLAIAYVWQKKQKQIEEKFKVRLNKAAPPGLVDICYEFYPKVLARTKKFYKEHEDGIKEIDANKRTKFFHHLATEIGVDLSKLPFKSE